MLTDPKTVKPYKNGKVISPAQAKANETKLKKQIADLQNEILKMRGDFGIEIHRLSERVANFENRARRVEEVGKRYLNIIENMSMGLR